MRDYLNTSKKNMVIKKIAINKKLLGNPFLEETAASIYLYLVMKTNECKLAEKAGDYLKISNIQPTEKKNISYLRFS